MRFGELRTPLDYLHGEHRVWRKQILLLVRHQSFGDEGHVSHPVLGVVLASRVKRDAPNRARMVVRGLESKRSSD